MPPSMSFQQINECVLIGMQSEYLFTIDSKEIKALNAFLPSLFTSKTFGTSSPEKHTRRLGQGR